MEFYVDKTKFYDELSRLMGVIEKKSSIPILESILVKPNNDLRLKLSATNLSLGINSYCAVEQLTGTDSLCIPSRRLFDIIKLMPEGLIKISGDTNQWIHIKAKGSNFKIPGYDYTAYPELPAVPTDDDWLNVPCKTFRNLLKGVEFAMSTTEDNRFSIAGIKVEIDDSSIRMVATDGHRLSLASSNFDALLLNTIDVLLPRRAVDELSKLLSDFEGDIGIALTPNDMFFRIGVRTFYARLLVGQFPAYKGMLANTCPYFATFQADILSQSIKRAMVVADDKDSGVLFNFAGGKVHLFASTADAGECNEIFDTDFNGGNLRLVCRGKFLLDFLEQMGKDRVRFDIKDNSAPIYLSSVRGNILHRYVVTPMRDREIPNV